MSDEDSNLIFLASISVLLIDNLAFVVYELLASLSATAINPPPPVTDESFTIALFSTLNSTLYLEFMFELLIFVATDVLNSVSVLLTLTEIKPPEPSDDSISWVFVATLLISKLLLAKSFVLKFEIFNIDEPVR